MKDVIKKTYVKNILMFVVGIVLTATDTGFAYSFW